MGYFEFIMSMVEKYTAALIVSVLQKYSTQGFKEYRSNSVCPVTSKQMLDKYYFVRLYQEFKTSLPLWFH